VAVAIGVGACGYLVNQTGGSSATTSPGVATQASGSTVVCCAGVADTTNDIAAPTDNKSGNSYPRFSTIVDYPSYPGAGTALYADTTVNGGTGHTWTKSCTSNSEVVICSVEVTGADSIGQVSNVTRAASGSNATVVSGTLTVTQDCVLVCFLMSEGYYTANPTAAGWTYMGGYLGTSNSIQGAAFARAVSAGTYSCSIATTGASQAVVIRLVEVYAAAVVGDLVGNATIGMVASGQPSAVGSPSGGLGIGMVASGQPSAVGSPSGGLGIGMVASGQPSAVGSLSGAMSVGIGIAGRFDATAIGDASIGLSLSGALSGVANASGNMAMGVTSDGAESATGNQRGSATISVMASGSLSVPAGTLIGSCGVSVISSGQISGVGNLRGSLSLSISAEGSFGGTQTFWLWRPSSYLFSPRNCQ